MIWFLFASVLKLGHGCTVVVKSLFPTPVLAYSSRQKWCPEYEAGLLYRTAHSCRAINFRAMNLRRCDSGHVYDLCNDRYACEA
jgi:hypothetical protein